MDKEGFSELFDIIKGLDWLVFSGMAVKLYGDSNRDLSDIDFIVSEQDIGEFASRLGAEVEDRDYVKDGNHIDDQGFETVFRGIEVEASSGFPPKRVQEDNMQKLFEHSEKKNFWDRK